MKLKFVQRKTDVLHKCYQICTACEGQSLVCMYGL